MTEELRITIWDREFTLPVKYDCYKGEEVTSEQKASFQSFTEHPEWIETAKILVEDYCKEAVLQDEQNNKKDNIFSYVMPDYIFVRRSKKKPKVALICKYRYDFEHGLAVMFAMDGTVNVGNQELLI